MATTTTLLQHPLHDQHPLEPLDFSKRLVPPCCDLCYREISADGYACLECKFYAHRVCAEAPHWIDLHPLHPSHPLTLYYGLPSIINHVCNLCDSSHENFFRCDECDFNIDNFNIDIGCALSTLEQIKLPFHIHMLTSFSTRHNFIVDRNCVICKASVEGDGYACLLWECEFLIHKRCIQDLYYTDGTKAPQVYHGHPLEAFLGKDLGSSKCANCRSKSSSVEFIGCASCHAFCCRDCVQVPESIQYPHHPDHALVLLIDSNDNGKQHCDSCLYYLKGKLCYGCPSCQFYVDMRCALQVLAYCEEGMSTEIELSWHKYPLHLCHGMEYEWNCCSYCEDKAAGPLYTCKEAGCEIQLHKRCTEIESIIIHPHHPDHPLTLRNKDDFDSCGACSRNIDYLKFSCELCAFYLHAKCAAHVPTRKHHLHEHELLRMDNPMFFECNRCGTSTDASLFRCVPCNFNLHEECFELPPQVVNRKVHWHPLTLHEIFLEDDTGEYYCEHCEKTRDGRLGVYVCGECELEIPRIYHIECVLPELGKVYEQKMETSAIKRMAERIAIKSRQVSAAEEKLEEDKRVLDKLKRELDGLMMRNEELISGGVDPKDSV